MAKRRKRAKDQPNLKRFRASVDRFTHEHSADLVTRQVTNSADGLDHLSGGKQQRKGKTRKELRKEKRKFTKTRKLAFAKGQVVPNFDHVKQQKQDALETKINKRREKMKEKKKESRKQKKAIEKEEQQAEEVDVRKQGLLEANRLEERGIRQLEKQLKMTRRKSKSLPAAFINDGLDYLLDVVDESKMASLYQEGESLGSSSNDDAEEMETDSSDDDEQSGETNKQLLGRDGSDKKDAKKSDDIKSIIQAMKEIKDLKNSKSVKFSKDVHDKHDLPDESDIDMEFDENETDDGGSENESEHEYEDSENEAEESESEADDSENEAEDSESESEDSESEAEDSDDEESEGEGDESEAGDNELDTVNFEETKSEAKEDIYGRLLDKDGNVKTITAGSYIPPGKRLLNAAEDEKKKTKLDRIKKLLKGLINRVSESNLQSVSSQIEELYNANSRADMNTMLMDGIVEACVSPRMTPDRLVMEVAALIAILHSHVGTEVGAFLIQKLAEMFHSLFGDQSFETSKAVDNVVLLIGHLYNFKVVGGVLMFDILKQFTIKLTERDAEVMLLLLKNVGFSLRKDDPNSLKEAITAIQSKASSSDRSLDPGSSRMKFMLETIAAIRNNNIRKIPGYDTAHLEHLKKVLRNIIRGGALSDNILRIGLDDLLDAKRHGRWWIVGSAWDDTKKEPEADNMSVSMNTSHVSSHILELARKQRMNTDVRKNIFCVIMTSEDFVDAFEKLLHMGLKHQQEREITHVVIDCCLNEKNFNPYYAYLAQKFCEYDRRFQMTYQFSLWDKFKQMDSVTTRSSSNLAEFTAHLLATKALSLSIFKVLEFGMLEKPLIRFLKQVFESLFIKQEDHVIEEMFLRITPLTKLHHVHEGLKVFLRHFLLHKRDQNEPSTILLREKVTIAEKCLTGSATKMAL